MSLDNYTVSRDRFELEECGNLGFPCSVCVHRHGTDQDMPCRVCDHNANAVQAEMENKK